MGCFLKVVTSRQVALERLEALCLFYPLVVSVVFFFSNLEHHWLPIYRSNLRNVVYEPLMYSKYMGHGQLRLLLCVYTRKLEGYKEM